MSGAISTFKEKIKAIWKQAVSENWFEGIRLNLFGGSIRETTKYLKERNK